MKHVVAFLLLSIALAHGGAAYIAATVQANVKSIRLLVGTSPSSYSRTSVFAVQISENIQTVTNLLTNLVAGITNYIAVQVAGTNNVLSDISTNLLQTAPGTASDIQTVPVSMIIRFGTPIQVSRDFENWKERMVLQKLLDPELARLTYRILPDQPSLFFRSQPLLTPAPIP